LTAAAPGPSTFVAHSNAPGVRWQQEPRDARRMPVRPVQRRAGALDLAPAVMRQRLVEAQFGRVREGGIEHRHGTFEQRQGQVLLQPGLIALRVQRYRRAGLRLHL
jgi:hypothetical protein